MNKIGNPALRKSNDELSPAEKFVELLYIEKEPIINTIKPIIPSPTGIKCEMMDRLA